MRRERHMDAISRRNVLVAAPSWREIEHVTPAHHPLLSTSQRGSAARTRPCNIWREDEEGWGAVIQPGDFLRQKKRCLFCLLRPRAQPRMSTRLGAGRGTTASCRSHQQPCSRSCLWKAAAFSAHEIPKDKEKLADNMED